MNIGIIDPSPDWEGLKLETKELPHYGLKFSVQSVDDVLPGSKNRWTMLLDTGSGNDEEADDAKEADDASESTDKNASAADSMIQIARDADIEDMTFPKPLPNIPDELPLDHAQARKDGDQVAELYGEWPQKLDLHPGSALEIGVVNRTSTDFKLVSRGDGPELWFREGWSRAHPTVKVNLLLRTAKQDPGQGASARENVLLMMALSLLNEQLELRLADKIGAGQSYKIGATRTSLTFNFGAFAPDIRDHCLAVLHAFRQGIHSVDPDRLARLQDMYRMEYLDVIGMSLDIARSDLQVLLTDGRHSR